MEIGSNSTLIEFFSKREALLDSQFLGLSIANKEGINNRLNDIES